MIEHNTLTELVTDHYAIPAQFAQQHFLLDGAGALFWPKHDMLVFSDLHFEKGSFLTQFAHPLPRFDTQETLARMHLAIERYDPTSVLCLGDSFHDGNALQRMDDAHIKRLNEMIQQT
ncbi:MAG: metallophosphoesterase, partial [Pseudomonadota bacterium]